MARTRKYNRVIRYAKQKWSPVIKSGLSVIGGSTPAAMYNLVVNSTDTSNPTPVVIKVKHMKYQVDAAGGSATTPPTGIFSGIVYVPEGINLENAAQLQSLIASHPEWVMLYDLIDCSTAQMQETLRRACPLTRNLNSGDRIVLFFYADSAGVATTCSLRYIVSWVNRAN